MISCTLLLFGIGLIGNAFASVLLLLLGGEQLFGWTPVPAVPSFFLGLLLTWLGVSLLVLSVNRVHDTR